MSDTAVLALAAFFGNAGVAVTGIGMAIIYWFVIQLADACGYRVDATFAIFVQSLSLFAAQPLLLNNANPRRHAMRSLMQLFIPVTIISTPLGQIVGYYADVRWLQFSAGVLVLGVSTFEIHRNRALIASALHYLVASVVMQPKNQPLLGEATRVGEYFILEQLGSGSQGIVKLAQHKDSKEQFAIKIIAKQKTLGDVANAETGDDKIRKEVELLKMMSHSNITRLVEVIETDDHWYFVMELIRGDEIFDLLADRGAFDEATARQIMRQLLEAIHYMHSKGIMHRDLKPENIMLAEAPGGGVDARLVVKITDFGIAELVGLSGGRAATFCGTSNYCAPEVLELCGPHNTTGYGKECDLWSLGVVCFNLLAAFHPFDDQCSDTPLLEQMRRGLFDFDHPVWDGVSEAAKSFIRALLQVDPAKRLDAPSALAHEWLMTLPSALFDSKSLTLSGTRRKTRMFDTTVPVFFMIGSQRSGSNWLRTMLDEREDLAGPHPPHIMRDFMPILNKFGDLDNGERLRVLIDHVCTFVERNQVPWLTIHGRTIKFNRKEAESYIAQRLSMVRKKAAHADLPKGMHLLAVFDFVYNEFASANDKRFWMCKSMGMSTFHPLLLQYYGEHRLRYIYLVRDPRDVAMSFMKTPVGDCHYYPIITKWCGLQDAVAPIMESYSHILLKVHYEELLADKKNVVNSIYDFIGTRRFGMGLRRASVVGLDNVETLIDNAKFGRQAASAANLSTQFQNLVRGESFCVEQHAKWLNGDEPMSESDLLLIESVAHEHMTRLNYKPHFVPHAKEALSFTEEQIAEFQRINQLAIKGMMATLEVENPGDAARRQRQAEVLSQPAELIPSEEEDVCVDISDENTHQYPHKWPHGAELFGYLTQEEVAAGLTLHEHESIGADGTTILWAALSQKGYYPTDFNKLRKNQDAFDIQASIAGCKDKHWAAVFDGHGTTGDLCSTFAKVGVLKEFESAMRHGEDVTVAFREAHWAVNQALHNDVTIGDEKSGTTSVCLYIDAMHLYVSSLGDSVCMIGKLRTDGAGNETLEANVLTKKHKLNDPEERRRIESCGGRVMKESELNTGDSSTSHVTEDGEDGSTKDVDDGEQLRVYSAEDKNPGTAFSRSIGDSLAESLGVFAEPDVQRFAMSAEDQVLVLCSDGITDFISPDEIMKVCSLYNYGPVEACRALVGEAYKRWIHSEDRTDDITIIVGIRQDKQVAYMPGASFAAPSTALTTRGKVWTISMGFLSGFLGGLNGIRGPPIILYFLHSPLTMTKAAQKGNGAVITAVSVLMRVIVYAIESAVADRSHQFTLEDVPLYIVVLVASIGGVAIGQDIFQAMKDSQATIKTSLCFLLLLCGFSLFFESVTVLAV